MLIVLLWRDPGNGHNPRRPGFRRSGGVSGTVQCKSKNNFECTLPLRPASPQQTIRIRRRLIIEALSGAPVHAGATWGWHISDYIKMGPAPWPSGQNVRSLTGRCLVRDRDRPKSSHKDHTSCIPYPYTLYIFIY